MDTMTRISHSRVFAVKKQGPNRSLRKPRIPLARLTFLIVERAHEVVQKRFAVRFVEVKRIASYADFQFTTVGEYGDRRAGMLPQWRDAVDFFQQ